MILEDNSFTLNIFSIRQFLDIAPTISKSNSKIWLFKVLLLPNAYIRKTKKTHKFLIQAKKLDKLRRLERSKSLKIIQVIKIIKNIKFELITR